MSEIQYNTETKRGWRIILVDESGTDILHGYSRDKAEAHAKKVIHRYNAFEEGGLVEELRTACEAWGKVESEMKDNNPCPDLALRAQYRKEAVKLMKAALAKS